MKIKLLQPIKMFTRKHEIGEVIDVSIPRARNFIRAGLAEEIRDDNKLQKTISKKRILRLSKGYLQVPKNIDKSPEIVFLTGHLGHLGSAIYQKLSEHYHIIGYDLKDNQNILNYDQLVNAMQGCSFVIHGAGIPHPNPQYTFDDYWQANVLGTLNVLKAAEANKIKRFIYLCSGAVYGWDTKGKMTPLYFPIDELHPLLTSTMQFEGKLDGYAQSKLIAEQLVAWYGTNGCFRAEVLQGCYQAVSLRIAPALLSLELLSEKRLTNPQHLIDRKKTFWTNAEPKTVAHVVELILKSEAPFAFEVFNVAEKSVPPGVDLEAYLQDKYPNVPINKDWEPPQSLLSTKKLERMVGF